MLRAKSSQFFDCRIWLLGIKSIFLPLGGTIDLHLLKSRKSLTLERGYPLGSIDSYKLLFPFSLREGESNFLTVTFIVLLIYILYKGF